MCEACINSLSGYNGFGADEAACDAAMRAAIGAAVGAVVIGGALAALSKQNRATKGGIGVVVGALVGGGIGYVTCGLGAEIPTSVEQALTDGSEAQPASPSLKMPSTLVNLADMLALPSEPSPNSAGPFKLGISLPGQPPAPPTQPPKFGLTAKTSPDASSQISFLSRMLNAFKTPALATTGPKTNMTGGPVTAPVSSRSTTTLTAPPKVTYPGQPVISQSTASASSATTVPGRTTASTAVPSSQSTTTISVPGKTAASAPSNPVVAIPVFNAPQQVAPVSPFKNKFS